MGSDERFDSRLELAPRVDSSSIIYGSGSVR